LQIRKEEILMFVKDIVRILVILIILSIEFNGLLLLYSNRVLYTFCAAAAAAAAASGV
jgi:hypothetical protein